MAEGRKASFRREGESLSVFTPRALLRSGLLSAGVIAVPFLLLHEDWIAVMMAYIPAAGLSIAGVIMIAVAAALLVVKMKVLMIGLLFGAALLKFVSWGLLVYFVVELELEASALLAGIGVAPVTALLQGFRAAMRFVPDPSRYIIEEWDESE